MTPQDQILVDVEARLTGNMKITNAGYYATVAKITNATLKPFNGDDLPALNFWPGTDQIVLRGAGFEEHELEIFVEYYDRSRDLPFSQIVFKLAADVRLALHRSVAAPEKTDPPEPTLGGKLQTLQLESVVPQLGQGQAPWCGVLCSFTARYRVKSSDPDVFV